MREEPYAPPTGWQMEIFEVVPGLMVGTRLASTATYDTLGVDVIVDLEEWAWAWAPPVPTGKVFLSFPLEDVDAVVDPIVRDIAGCVVALMRAGRRVLVHCTEGLNRSGLVVARALMVMGMSAQDAIDLVRQKRGPSVDGFAALGNEAFVDWLRSEGGSTSC